VKTILKRLGLILRVLVASTIIAVGACGADLGYLASHADAIVAGYVTSRVETSSEISFTLNVVRVLRGEATTIAIAQPWTSLLRGQNTIGQYLSGMWFLTHSANGAWQVLTARPRLAHTALGLFLPAPPAQITSGPYAYGPGTALIDALIYEAAAGAAAENGDPDAIPAAFHSVDTPAVRSVLHSFLQSGNLSLEAVGLQGEIERLAPGALDQLAGLWPTVGTGPHRDDLLSALSMYWRDSSASSVQALISLAGRGDPELRLAAVTALASMHTENTLAYLASLLQSTDADEQVQAIYGISAFANGCPMKETSNSVSMAYLQCDQPSAYRTADTFSHFGFRRGTPDQESSLAAFWQSWWNAHSELH
jgi:hypothetical protein